MQPKDLAAATILSLTTLLYAAEPASQADKNFVAKVSQGGLYEVEAGKVAALKGASRVIKDFGTLESHDHEGVNAALKHVAAQTGVPIFKARPQCRVHRAPQQAQGRSRRPVRRLLRSRHEADPQQRRRSLRRRSQIRISVLQALRPRNRRAGERPLRLAQHPLANLIEGLSRKGKPSAPPWAAQPQRGFSRRGYRPPEHPIA